MGEQGKKPLKGIRISTANIGMMFISCILYIILILVTVHASKRYNLMISAMEDYVSCEENASLVREGSDFLTEQVRLYVVTFDRQCIDDYFEEVNTVRRRDSALEKMEAYDVKDEAYAYLQTALDNSNKLMEREMYAMKLVSSAQGDENSLPEEMRNIVLEEEDVPSSSEEKVEKARDMAFGELYRRDKEEIMENVTFFLNNIVNDTLEKQQNSVLKLKRTMAQQRMLISVLFIENIMIFFLIILLVIKPLRIYIENIEDKEKLKISGSYEFKYLALTYNNIYELNAVNEAKLHYRAEHDALTGIMNRGAFDTCRQILRTKQEPLALIIIDVDKFKQVNDGYGHEMGDKVLKQVAKLLVESFRSTDYPARIGGDEFAVVVTDAREDMRFVIDKKIREINETLLNPKGNLPKVSISVGVAFSSCGFEDDLYKKADEALYEVKKNGRCGCVFYEE